MKYKLLKIRKEDLDITCAACFLDVFNYVSYIVSNRRITCMVDLEGGGIGRSVAYRFEFHALFAQSV